MIAGTDAHAKNYSVLLQGNSARLAPLYDLGSGLLLGVHVHKLKLAMKVGGEYAPHKISRTNFERLATDFRLDPIQLIDRLFLLATQVPEALSEAANQPDIAALNSSTPALLTDAVAEWCRTCVRTLQSRRVPAGDP
jgi:serine/threonine-protein kinase HipA